MCVTDSLVTDGKRMYNQCRGTRQGIHLNNGESMMNINDWPAEGEAGSATTAGVTEIPATGTGK
jgi:hypothetical protein